MKKSNKWEQIAKARKTLQLGETATVNQIKQVYRELAKANHPDTAEPSENDETVEMQELNSAYQTLMRLCENYPVPLEKQEGDGDDEDWWFDRFGNDPVWAR